MTHLADLHPVAAVVIALLLIIGATLTLVGNLGLLLLRDFFQRLHAPTLGASWGTGAVALASMLTFTLLRGSLAIHELAIGIFIMVTTPIGLLLLGRAARRREFGDGPPPGLDSLPPVPEAEQDTANPDKASADTASADRAEPNRTNPDAQDARAPR